MSPAAIRAIGIGGFVLCAILLAIAWERYQDNASAVEAQNRLMESSPLGGMVKVMTGGAKLEPATPVATKYALGGAVLAAAGGVFCLAVGKKTGQRAADMTDLDRVRSI